MKTKRKSPPPKLTDYGRDTVITRENAVWLIGAEVARSDETPQQARNRVSNRLRYAMAKGRATSLKYHDEQAKDFVFGCVVAWAKDKWPDKFSGWPWKRGGVVLPGVSQLGTGSNPPTIPPNDIEGFRGLVERQEVELRALRDRNAASDRELEVLRQFKEQVVKRRRQGSAARKSGGGRPKKS